MKTLVTKKLSNLKKIVLMGGSLALFSACASGPNTRWCAFDDRREAGKRVLCRNMKYDYDANGNVKPSRENKQTYIKVDEFRDLRGWVMIPAGVDQENLRACAKKSRLTKSIDCGEFE